MLRRHFLLGSISPLVLTTVFGVRRSWSSSAGDAAGDSPLVKTRSGPVRGSVADGIHVFKGIPFAAPPFGPNRLQPPKPVEPWGGVRDVLAFGPKPPQVAYPPGIGEYLAEFGDRLPPQLRSEHEKVVRALE